MGFIVKERMSNDKRKRKRKREKEETLHRFSFYTKEEEEERTIYIDEEVFRKIFQARDDRILRDFQSTRPFSTERTFTDGKILRRIGCPAGFSKAWRMGIPRSEIGRNVKEYQHTDPE